MSRKQEKKTSNNSKLSETYSVTMSSVSNPETFSSNWHVLLGIFTETSFAVSGIALLINDSTAAAEQEAGMHIPNEMAVPLSGLD